MQGIDAARIRQVIGEYFAVDDHDVAAVYLYGSVARGGKSFHDVDMALLLPGDPPLSLEGLHLDLASELESRLGITVDLLVLNTAPVDLVHRVLRDGVLLVERDRSLRIRFEVKARNEYFDLEPILLEYRKAREEGR